MDTIFNIRINGATIHTTVTSYSSTITDWIQTTNNTFQFHQSAILGLDVEWKPSHTRGVQNPVATLQICADNRCLIIQLLHLDRIPPSLGRFLTNPRYKFAGVEIAGDAWKLESQLGLICRNLYDLREEALRIWPERLSRCPGLKELAREAAGFGSLSFWIVVLLKRQRGGFRAFWEVQYDNLIERTWEQYDARNRVTGGGL